ncbi:hypothetical protein EV663_103164 [Rhodovulum bhavnagarense]|uniref:Uncharacterized protein n=1 Tax=Rhodovulum bhavnagarense TaxID=992286 RepID=A0A4R2RIK8_9RHOB|nr:hypothetical protein EV663_103164 [Rhodovulum bhavnagarense]
MRDPRQRKPPKIGKMPPVRRWTPWHEIVIWATEIRNVTV